MEKDLPRSSFGWGISVGAAEVVVVIIVVVGREIISEGDIFVGVVWGLVRWVVRFGEEVMMSVFELFGLRLEVGLKLWDD